MRIRAAAMLVLLPMLACHPAPKKIGTVDRVTVPLVLEGDRPFVDLIFARANGTVRSARFLVDTGADAFYMTEALAHDVDLQWGDLVRAESGDAIREVAPVTTPVQAFAGEFPLDLEAAAPTVLLKSEDALEGEAHADGILPGRLLCQYHVVLDYPAGSMTLSRAGVIAPIGEPMSMPVSAALGLARTEVEVGGSRYGFLIETGAPRTRVSTATLASWGAHDGTATLRWGTIELPDQALDSDSTRVFKDEISPRMTSSVVGALASDLLKRFRVDLDYPHQTLYLSGATKGSK